MTPPFPFEPLIVFGFLSAMLLTGVLFRAYVPFFQKIMFPASLTGGMAGFLLLNLDLFSIDVHLVKTFAYHFFNISFISLGLTSVMEQAPAQGETKIIKGSAWMAAVQAVTFPLQAITGTLVAALLVWAGHEPLFKTFGFLLPLAFNEGPGQALSIGSVWETMGFSDASTIGLTLAAAGYFFAFFAGVPLANAGVKKAAYNRGRLPEFFVRGILPDGQKGLSAGTLTTHGANLDSLALHTAMAGLVYIITYAVVAYGSSLLPPDAGSMLWGFFFLFGLVIAILFRTIVHRTTRLGHLMDPATQNRITGLSVDYLVVATGCGIQVFVLWKYIVPVMLIAVAGGIVTTLMVFMLSRRLKAYRLERAMAIYGVVTGTVSCGLMLLRIVDPEFKTPVAREIGFMNIFAVPVIGGLTCLLNAPFWWGWSVFFTCLVLFVTGTAALVFTAGRFLWK